MNNDFPKDMLMCAGQTIARNLGLHFPPERHEELLRGLTAAASAMGFGTDIESFLNTLNSRETLSSAHCAALAPFLTVAETYFMREERHFALMAEHMLPEIARNRHSGDRTLRILSAACCTGEEAYSIAMLIRQFSREFADWQVSIIGTDINPEVLEKARTGIYGEWSFRNTPGWVKTAYFRPNGKRFELIPEIRQMVRFEAWNLVQDSPQSMLDAGGAFDIIFCRNVLMYFSAMQAKRAIQNLYTMQREGGCLLVGSSELMHLAGTSYVSKPSNHGTVHQKCTGGGTMANGLAPAKSRTGAVSAASDNAHAVRKPLRATAAPDRQSVPTDPAAAAECYKRGEYDQCAKLLHKLIANAGPTPEFVSMLTRSLANLGRTQEALESSKQWVAADKCNAAAHYWRAMIQQECAESAEAVQSLHRARYLDPQFVMPHYALGIIALRHDQAAESRKHFTYAMKLLEFYCPGETLPESDGMTAAALSEIIRSHLLVEAAT